MSQTQMTTSMTAILPMTAIPPSQTMRQIVTKKPNPIQSESERIELSK